MSNKFYKPKNELGEFLISEVKTAKLISAAETTINLRIDKVEEGLDNTNKNLKDGLEDVKKELMDFVDDAKETIDSEINRIETQFNEKHSLGVETFDVPAGVSSYDVLDTYIAPKWEAALNDEETRKKFAKGLAETIYIAKTKLPDHDCDNSCECKYAYEEFYCINAPAVAGSMAERPNFTRLGAVESILASDKRYGSVILKGKGIYDTKDWSNYEVKTELQDEYHPVTGYAVAPIALREFKEHDIALSNKIDSVKKELDDADSDIGVRIDGIDEIIAAIRGELKGTEEDGQLSGSRIDRIEDLIGLNGCSKCGHDKCAVNPEEDGSILCRLTDLKNDSETHWEQINVIDTALGTQGEADEEGTVTVWGSILKNSTDITTHSGNISEINSQLDTHDGNIFEINSRLDGHDGRIAAAETSIATNTKSIEDNNKLIAANKDDITNIKASLGENIDNNDKTPAWSYILKNTKDIEANNTYINSVERSLGAFIGSVEKSLGEYPDDYKNKNITAWGQITENDRVIQANNNRINGEISEINTEINRINGEISGINTEISGINDALNQKITTNEGKIVTLEESVSKIDTRVSSNETSIEGINVKVTALETYRDETANERFEAIETSLGTNTEPDIHGSAWHNILKLITSLNACIEKDSEISEDIKAVNTAIGEAKTEAITEANTYTDTKYDAAIVEATNISSNTLKESKEYADTKIVEANDYSKSLLIGQPSVAVIACGLAEGEVTQNGESTWANSTTILASNFVDRLPYVNNSKNVNFAVTSVRYTSDDPLIAGEQITPEILYFGQTTNDATNGRSARITFNDFKRKPQTLLVTITYWEDDKVFHV